MDTGPLRQETASSEPEPNAPKEERGDRPLKILQTNFHREWNGQVARVFLLSRELIRKGHQAVIAAPENSALAERARSAGIPVFTSVRFNKTNRPVSFLRDVIALGRLIREESFDCLHAHGSQDTWALVWAHRLFRLRQPILLTRHNTKHVRFHFGNRWLYRRGIDRVVVVSAAAMDNYRRFLDANILKERDIPIIHSCIDLDRFTKAPDPEKIRAELNVDKDAPIIGLIGRVGRDKGHFVLLQAIPEVLKEFPHAVFIFAGNVGGLGQAMRDSVRGQGLEKSVRLLGFREDIVDITAALDLSVLPSLGTDSSPAVVKEAMYLGKPVIASRIAGLPEIVGAESGILVAPGNVGELARAIITTLRNREKGWSQGGDFPSRFTPAFMCEAYLRVYDEMRKRSSK